MPSCLRQFRGLCVFCFSLLLTAGLAAGQAKESLPSAQAPSLPTPQKPPAIVDPTGQGNNIQTSEPLFDVAVALNECGYDQELETSDPLRQHVRDQVNQYLQGSAEARDARDRVCAYIAQHRLSDSGRDLAQYISLALYLTPPPELKTSVELTEMPPDSTQVVEMLPLLRAFVAATDLHVIWVSNHAAYEEEINKLHDPLTRMILATNVYLKMPASGYDGRRFLVVLEPLLAPGYTNARVYGTDYVVVASPVNGLINMKEVHHTYLHYEIEPLLYARVAAMDRMLPILKAIREAPLDYTFRSDIVSLTTECLIRAIEARTYDTGIPVVKAPSPDMRRIELEKADRERNEYLQKVAAAREQVVAEAMSEGFVLTQYFYEVLGPFSHDAASLKETIGEMVYGMDVDQQINRAKHTAFSETASSDVVSHSPKQLHGLDLAEMKLIKGDQAGAAQLAQQTIEHKTGDPGYAHYILGQVSLLGGKMDDAEQHFEEAVKFSKDPRTLAWAHIYLGRIHDVEEDREEAVAEYKAALTVRDGQADTKQAAEKGLKAPFALPKRAEPDEDAAPEKSPKQ